MEVIMGGRGSGKTKKLIQLSSSSWKYIVCKDEKEIERITDFAREMGLRIPFPITYRDFLEKKYYGRGIKGFLIDNADMLIQNLSPVVPIDVITIREGQKNRV